MFKFNNQNFKFCYTAPCIATNLPGFWNLKTILFAFTALAINKTFTQHIFLLSKIETASMYFFNKNLKTNEAKSL